MIKEIINKDKIIAIIIKSQFNQDGINFFTPPEDSLQIAYMKRPINYEILPHVHKPVPREVTYTKEVLYIKSGKVRIDFYDDKKEYIESHILQSGDVILLSYGAHGFFMLEETEIIEVKQGPYAGENDKVRFDSIDINSINIV